MHAPSRPLSCLALVLALAACQRGPATDAAAPASPRAYTVQDWQLPAPPGAAQPDLVATSNGQLLLSWISSVEGRRNALQFSALGENGHWQSAPRTIAVGNSLMANWANTPHIAATADGALWVQWLQKSGGGHAADVMLARSTDGGFSWGSAVRLNDDPAPAEHGFASLWPQDRDHLGVAWLSGTPAADGAHDATEGHGGNTSLRAAVFAPDLTRGAGQAVDAMTCDCCQTDVAMTTRGALLVYRGRTRDEVRDILASRFDGAAWSKPVPVHADGWIMSACPVNGPAVVARGNDVVVAWYTAAQDTPSIRLARSRDAGDHFDAPVTVESGEAVQGRVAVALDAQQAWVAWIREDARGQSLWLARYAPDLSRELQRVEVAKLQGRGRGTGFPQLVVRGDGAWLAWTDAVAGVAQLKGAHIPY
jgi:hypothetical protein